MNLELNNKETATLNIVLQLQKLETKESLTLYTNKLNASNNTNDVNWYNELVKSQREKLDTVNNLLNKIK